MIILKVMDESEALDRKAGKPFFQMIIWSCNNYFGFD